MASLAEIQQWRGVLWGILSRLPPHFAQFTNLFGVYVDSGSKIWRLQRHDKHMKTYEFSFYLSRSKLIFQNIRNMRDSNMLEPTGNGLANDGFNVREEQIAAVSVFHQQNATPSAGPKVGYADKGFCVGSGVSFNLLRHLSVKREYGKIWAAVATWEKIGFHDLGKVMDYLHTSFSSMNFNSACGRYLTARPIFTIFMRP